MPACGNCTQPCSCTVSEDGFYSGTLGLGRNFTQVEGNGSEDDPFVFHFLDQQEFRPKTAEILYANETSGFSYARVHGPPYSTLNYQSPIVFLLKEPNQPDYRYIGANYYIIGASATFADQVGAVDTTLGRDLLLTTSLTTTTEYVIGGQTSAAITTDPVTMTVEGFVPGLFTVLPTTGSVITRFNLYVFSGDNTTVSDIRVWITQI